MKIRILFIMVIAFVVVLSLPRVDGSASAAQGGMSKATAKMLITDLIEAGFAPQIREQGGVYFVVVSTTAATAGTASQVNTFATNRGVAAKVLTVQFE
jgi:hypothetical protein